MRSLDRVDWQWYLICFLNVCFLLFWWICRGFWMDANRDSRTCPQILCSQNTYIQWEAAPYSASHWNVRNLESSNTKSPEDISFLEERPIEWSEGIACYLTWELGISLLLLPELAEGQSQHAIETLQSTMSFTVLNLKSDLANFRKSRLYWCYIISRTTYPSTYDHRL